MKNKLIIALIILIILANILILIFASKGKDNTEKSYTRKEIIELISKGYINGMSKKNLENLMGQKLDDKTIITGNNAYLLKKPSKEIIEQYNLNNYVQRNESYFENLTNKIKSNYSWKFDGDVKDNQTQYIVKIKTYNYGIYIQDFEELTNLLLTNDKNDTSPQNVKEYKAKVIAMKILDTHLDDYLNNDEEKTILINFSGQSDDIKNSLAQYLVDLGGYNYHNIPQINEMVQNRNTRLQSYIDESFQNGTLDRQSVLKI